MPPATQSDPAVSGLALLETLLPSRRPVSLHEPWFTPAEAEAVADAVASGWVSTAAAQVAAFEAGLEQYAPGMTAVATHSGTTALFLAARMLGCGAGTEVLLPSLTFVATANALCRAGAVPHFYDVRPPQTPGAASMSASAQQLDDYLDGIAVRRGGVTRNKATGRRISGLVAVHLLGFAAADLQDLCQAWNLRYIEDTAAALGSRYRPARADACIFSFNGNKIITAGGGGAVLFRNPDHARAARHYARQARIEATDQVVAHDGIADNLLLPGLNAALGLSQLQRFEQILQRKLRVHQFWLSQRAAWAEQGWQLLTRSSETDTVSNWWLNALVWQGSAKRTPVFTLAGLACGRRIFIKPLWKPLHQLAMFAACPRPPALEHTGQWFNRLLCLPSSPTLV